MTSKTFSFNRGDSLDLQVTVRTLRGVFSKGCKVKVLEVTEDSFDLQTDQGSLLLSSDTVLDPTPGIYKVMDLLGELSAFKK